MLLLGNLTVTSVRFILIYIYIYIYIRNFCLSNGIEKAGETESDSAETVTKRSVHPARPLTFGTVTDLHAFFLDPTHQLRGTLA